MKINKIWIEALGMIIFASTVCLGLPLLMHAYAELREAPEIIVKSKNQPGTKMTDCTGFIFSDGQTVYAGGNEDFREKDFYIWFEPAANENEYGSVFIGYPLWNGKLHAFHGMNTAGLYHDSFGGAQKELKGMLKLPEYDGSRPLHEDVMMKNATVDEAIEFMGHYYHALYKTDMSLFGDTSCNAAVKEGDVVVKKKGEFMVLTNFMLSKVDSPMTVCDRYRIATNMLNEKKRNFDLARAILSNTHNEGIWSTKYSVICDLTHTIMYIYYFHDFEEVYVLNLKEELKLGKRSFPLKNLFSEKFQEKVWTKTYKQREQNEEAQINYLGYSLLNLKLFDEAINVLKVNTERYPDSWNSWDSLAEAYYRKGDKELAIKYYKQSIELNPNNENGLQKLKKIKAKDQ
jgi:tetratricopeptide (TPR) repeat protein